MATSYTAKALAGTNTQRTFSNDSLEQIAFPLGGLGAGCLHLGGAGNFQDFCLFNRPTFGHSPMTFAAVHCRTKGRKDGTLRVLEGPVQTPHIYNQARFGNGGLDAGHEGLPHMESAEFKGEFPFAWVALKDRALPLQISLEAYSPFIPGDADASGLPAAFVTYRLRNRSKRSLQIQFSFNVQYPEKAGLHGHEGSDLKGHQVQHRRQGATGGLYFDSDLPADHVRKTSIAVVSPRPAHKADCAWFRGGWFDALTMLTNDLLAGKLKSAAKSEPAIGGRSRFGATLFWDLELKPGETAEIPLIYCWYAPNTELSHGQAPAEDCGDEDSACATPTAYKPHYATRFADAWQVAQAAIKDHEILLHCTQRFHRTLFSSILPDYVLDAVSANLAILKSPTVLRQHDGMLWNWEGSSYGNGCCAGSCTHVWNYAQAIPYLFPELERSLRDQELQYSMDKRGHVTFRSALPTGATGHGFHAAADGQLGGIMKTYREWLIYGDDAWLKAHYPLARRSLEYCIRTWDPDGKGALIEPHHNTYDIEFWGPDVMCTSFYLGALSAMAQMAKALGKDKDVHNYNALAQKGKAFCDAQLWNGEYYIQKVQWKELRAGKRLKKWVSGTQVINDSAYSTEALKILKKEGPKYQYGSGCISDGVMGQWFTTMLGLPDALNRGRTKRHLKAIFKHNFQNSLRGHANPQRPGYALNNEPGLLLCSWPHGGKPSLPFVYSDEVWTGIEYQVASHMLYEGMLEEGLTIVKAVRQRYEGKVRNPWNEYECGNYYARALASYGLLLALSGFRYHAAAKRLEIAPQLKVNKGRFLFSVDSGWGTIHYEKKGGNLKLRIQMEEGCLELAEVQVSGPLVGAGQGTKLALIKKAQPEKTISLELK
jgi:uncharacterized protein (DUF608 family)